MMEQIETNRWYRVIIEGQERIVRVDSYTIKYAVVDYYDGRVWFISRNLRLCKKWVMERRG